ncbi:MAG TPA: zinc metallopeptidase [Candidatus Limnocylindrales bacterium]|nr:zinc metallopeptidase [Candidatus Limnocylindrales bacterium]
MFFDPVYLIFFIAIIVVSSAAQLYIRSTYGRWSRVPNGAGLSGGQVAEYLRDHARFGNRSGRDAITAINVVPGDLSDHFDPRDRSLSLSEVVAHQPSIASMAIAAHEVGHAQQLAEGSALMQFRALLVPAVSVGPGLAYLFIIGGLILNMTGLLTIGILLFGVAVLFSVLTLPVEIQASQKALSMLESTGVVTSAQDRAGARSMLTAAALTYLAAAIGAILTLLYYLTLARRSN